MKITLRFEISIDLIKFVMRKKIKLWGISSWFAPREKKSNLLIKFILNYKILNQHAYITVNLQIDEFDKIRSISLSFIILLVSYEGWIAA